VTRVGWQVDAACGTWKYVNRSAAPPGGITGVRIRDLSSGTLGLVGFSVRGRHGSYPVDPAHLPLGGLLVVDPPTAETGQCAQATFTGPAPTCLATGGTIRCR
jgi:hypothetical protein